METTPSTSSGVSLQKKMPNGLQNNTMRILEHKITGEDMHDILHALEQQKQHRLEIDRLQGIIDGIFDRIATYIK